ncbi:uncharacterized protein LOC125378714 isoform X2 [Haliotis rufescens]|uniref:uncharacterized protein LOC125378714 isoform X2 n=1 Tax=Haliotis rufescens TaxID=6454 RepID=UPI00201F2FE0|nr:uncharacterized protein LOC125378714 isoform X2 [Haliotis rufescens]
MKTLLILFCVAGLCKTVHSSCTACVVGTPKSLCTEEYIPSGPESKACASISQVLCKTYGNYEIFCTTLTTDVHCKKVGYCSGARLAPGLVLISVVLAFVIKIVH